MSAGPQDAMLDFIARHLARNRAKDDIDGNRRLLRWIQARDIVLTTIALLGLVTLALLVQQAAARYGAGSSMKIEQSAPDAEGNIANLDKSQDSSIGLMLTLQEPTPNPFRLRIFETPSFKATMACEESSHEVPIWDQPPSHLAEATLKAWAEALANVPEGAPLLAMVAGSHDGRTFTSGNENLAARRARCTKNWIEANSKPRRIQWFENNNTAVLPHRGKSGQQLESDRRAVVVLLSIDHLASTQAKERAP